MRVHTDHARATFRALPWTARQPARGESVDDPAAVLERRSPRKSLLTMPLGGRVVEPGEREPPGFAVVRHVGVLVAVEAPGGELLVD